MDLALRRAEARSTRLLVGAFGAATTLRPCVTSARNARSGRWLAA